MTTRDNIYKNYQQGGESWATLGEEIHPLFKQFLNQSDFEFKHVLDIGCGTGKYLKFLQASGFQTNGIDSSETAVEMTKKNLGDNSNIQCTNMFGYEIPQNTYDLIISISTIHHGTKEQVQNLINKIHDSLKINGKIFITVPDFEIAKQNDVWKDDQKIDIGTYAPTIGPEKGLPHSFYTKEEVEKLFAQFKNIQIEIDEIGRWIIQSTK